MNDKSLFSLLHLFICVVSCRPAAYTWQ